MKSFLAVIIVVFLMAGIVNASSRNFAVPARRIGITAINCGDVLTSSYNMTSDLTNCPGNGIQIGASNIILDCQGHTLTGSPSSFGIYLNGVSGDTIKNCIITNFYLGINLQYSSNNILTNNTAESNGDGIMLQYSSNNNNTITNNTANNNTQNGIFLHSSSNNILTNNAANSNHEGIFLYSSSNNILTNNAANSNYEGILLLYSSSNNNTITNNTVNSNSYDGIALWYSSNNNILTSNTLNSNQQYGIWLDGSANSNSIYNNYFNNSVNAVDTGTNFWNTTKTLGTNIISGPYIGGNFWSDYAGVDTNGDGIGETLVPYTSNGNITNGGDYLPLTTLVGPINITILSPTNSSYYKTYVPLNFTINKPTSWIGYSVNNRSNVTINGSTNLTVLGYNGPTKKPADYLVRGWNNLTVYANDTSGNMGSSKATFFYCLADINGDRTVNILDAIILSNNYLTTNPIADLNGDGQVNILDSIILSNNYGKKC
jgi:parallel beta-helix repeat protein